MPEQNDDTSIYSKETADVAATVLLAKFPGDDAKASREELFKQVMAKSNSSENGDRVKIFSLLIGFISTGLVPIDTVVKVIKDIPSAEKQKVEVVVESYLKVGSSKDSCIKLMNELRDFPFLVPKIIGFIGKGSVPIDTIVQLIKNISPTEKEKVEEIVDSYLKTKPSKEASVKLTDELSRSYPHLVPKIIAETTTWGDDGLRKQIITHATNVDLYFTLAAKKD